MCPCLKWLPDTATATRLAATNDPPLHVSLPEESFSDHWQDILTHANLLVDTYHEIEREASLDRLKHTSEVRDLFGETGKYRHQIGSFAGTTKLLHAVYTETFLGRWLWFQKAADCWELDTEFREVIMAAREVKEAVDDPDPNTACFPSLHKFTQTLSRYGRKATELMSKTIAEAMPERFNYKGFRVHNPDHLIEDIGFRLLSGVDYLVGLFKRRNLNTLLKDCLNSVMIRFQRPTDTHIKIRGLAHGLYNPQKKTITLLHAVIKEPTGRLMKKWVYEVLLHEFGHHVHMSYLHPAAKEEWDSGWTPVEEAKQALLRKMRVLPEERKRFWELLLSSKGDLAKVKNKLKGMDKPKFHAWLANPMMGGPFVTPKQLRWTPQEGTWLKTFLENPEGRFSQYSERGWPEGEVDRRIKRHWGMLEDTLAVDYDKPYPDLPEALVEEYRKQDKSVEEAIEKLQVPTWYAKTDKEEDFAETFVAFMEASERLSEQAVYRMKRALWMSGFYGKPVMRLSSAKAVAQHQQHDERPMLQLNWLPSKGVRVVATDTRVEKDLNKWATSAFEIFHIPGGDPAERSRSVAYGVAAMAVRHGISKDVLKRWLQGAYSSIWVRLSQLNCGMDLKDVWKALEYGYDAAAKRRRIAQDVVDEEHSHLDEEGPETGRQKKIHKGDPFPSVFRDQMKRRGKIFRSPKTGRKILFTSLPWLEQLKYYKRWKTTPEGQAHKKVKLHEGEQARQETREEVKRIHQPKPKLKPTPGKSKPPAIKKLKSGETAATGSSLGNRAKTAFSHLARHLKLSDDDKKEVAKLVATLPADKVNGAANYFKKDAAKYGSRAAARGFARRLGIHKHGKISPILKDLKAKKRMAVFEGDSQDVDVDTEIVKKKRKKANKFKRSDDVAQEGKGSRWKRVDTSPLSPIKKAAFYAVPV